jgi:Xaa-Pro aminopeptidase
MDADGVIITFIPHVRWMSGFSGSYGLLHVDRVEARLVTDGRYRQQAAAQAPDFDVYIAESDLIGFLAGSGWLSSSGTNVVQGDHITFSNLQRLRNVAADASIHAEDGFMNPLIAVKDDVEIECIAAAQRVTDEVFFELVEWIEPGMSERQVAAEIVCRHLHKGAERMSFEPIVASGPNSSLPHARPGDRTLREGDCVVVDFGCVWDGYSSDMTRTIAIGKPSRRVLHVYNVVLGAQQAALGAARSGMPARELDRVARGYIEDRGYGDGFSHSLGHGVGLEVHEWPRISSSSDYELPERAVVSIEPGVYVPDHFGVRIEDLVVLQPDGCRNLTRAPKELIVV